MRINLENISYEIEGKKILKDISLKINNNELIIIYGESGSGKTSLLKLISGIYQTKKYKSKLIRKDIAYFFQEIDYQLSFNSIKKEIYFHNNKKIVNENIKLFNLEDLNLETSPFIYSEGIRRKIALITILSSESNIFLLDEPTINLDKKSIDSLIRIINKLIKNNKTVIIVSHNDEFINKLNHRKIIMENGEITN